MAASCKPGDGPYVRRETMRSIFADAAITRTKTSRATTRSPRLADTAGRNTCRSRVTLKFVRPRENPRILGHAGQGLVDLPRRSKHPHFQSYAAGRPVLGRLRYCHRLRQNGRRRDDRYATEYGREPKGSDAMTQIVGQESQSSRSGSRAWSEGPRSPYPVTSNRSKGAGSSRIISRQPGSDLPSLRTRPREASISPPPPSGDWLQAH